MPKLVNLKFTHYSPKKSKTGTRSYLICDDIMQTIERVDKLTHGLLKDWAQEGRTGQAYISEADPRLSTVADFGLVADKYGDVSGNAVNLTMWYGGTDWQEATDYYYGVTHYHWRDVQEISDDDAATLVRLGIAEDMRVKP